MLIDLRQYITNDYQFVKEVQFFYMICQRCRDYELVKSTIGKLISGMDNAIDIEKPSHWLTNVFFNAEIEDLFELEDGFVIDMLLKCFNGGFNVKGWAMDAASMYLIFREKIRSKNNKKKLKSKYDICLNEYLEFLDSYLEDDALKKTEEDFILEWDDQLAFDEIIIRSENKCKEYELLESILAELGFKQVNKKIFAMWGMYDMSCGYCDYEGHLEITQCAIDLLSELPIINDISEFNYFFDNISFECTNSVNLYRSLLNSVNNRRDVVF